MNDQRKRFCDRYFETLNACQSAIDASYSPDTARQIGYNLLQEEEIQEYLQKLRLEYQEKSGINKDRILAEYAKIAFSDIRELYAGDNNLLDVRQMDDNTAAAVMSVEVDELVAQGGVFIGNTKKVKLYNKLAALDALGKVLGVFEKDNQQRTPNIKILNVDPLANVEDNDRTTEDIGTTEED